MKRTTIITDEALFLEAKYLAARDGKTFTDVVREALREYVTSHQEASPLSIVGIGRSGASDVSERVDEILKAEVTPTEGWAPRRAGSDLPASRSRKAAD